MTATDNGFFRYAFTIAEVLGLVEESVQVSKRARGSRGGYTTVNVTAVPVVFRAGRRRSASVKLVVITMSTAV